MITGVPNVGKSTIINALAKAAKTSASSTGHRTGARRSKSGTASNKFGSDEYRPAAAAAAAGSGGPTKHLARVGDRPGVTRAVASILVSAAPSLVRMLDTPGIMLPKVSGPEQGLKLALTGAVRDEVSEALISKVLVSEALVSKVLVSEALISKVLVSEALISKVLVSEALVSKVLLYEASD